MLRAAEKERRRADLNILQSSGLVAVLCTELLSGEADTPDRAAHRQRDRKDTIAHAHNAASCLTKNLKELTE